MHGARGGVNEGVSLRNRLPSWLFQRVKWRACGIPRLTPSSETRARLVHPPKARRAAGGGGSQGCRGAPLPLDRSLSTPGSELLTLNPWLSTPNSEPLALNRCSASRHRQCTTTLSRMHPLTHCDLSLSPQKSLAHLHLSRTHADTHTRAPLADT